MGKNFSNRDITMKSVEHEKNDSFDLGFEWSEKDSQAIDMAVKNFENSKNAENGTFDNVKRCPICANEFVFGGAKWDSGLDKCNQCRRSEQIDIEMQCARDCFRVPNEEWDN